MITDPTPYRERFGEISEKAGDLLPKFESGDYTFRDIAILNNLMSEYAETLDEILTEGFKVDGSIIILVDGVKVKFQNIDKLSEYLAGVMNATI